MRLLGRLFVPLVQSSHLRRRTDFITNHQKVHQNPFHLNHHQQRCAMSTSPSLHVDSYKDAVSFLLRDAKTVANKQDRQHRTLQPMHSLIEGVTLLCESSAFAKIAKNPTETESFARRVRIIHVAGTNGKGSVCAMVDSVLRAMGFRTGLFTSPHLHSFRERIRVDGKLIPASDVTRIVNEIAPLMEAQPDIHIFDRITAVAYKHFMESNVDWIVLETGLGGRLDSTNAFQPVVSVITSIGFDHMNVLGNTIQEIAQEKAGIIKPGIPAVVSSLQMDGALQVFEETAKQVGAPLTVAGRAELDQLSLEGEYQKANKGVVLETLKILHKNELIPWNEDAIHGGLRSTFWPARFERMPDPKGEAAYPMVVDGGHNETAVQRLVESTKSKFDTSKVVVIFGAGSDKDYVGMLQSLVQSFQNVVIFKSNHPRAVPSAQIVEHLSQSGILTETTAKVHAVNTADEAFDAAVQLLTESKASASESFILGTGSLFVAAELRELWHRRFPSVFPKGDFVYAPLEES